MPQLSRANGVSLLLTLRKSGLPEATQTCGYAFETRPRDTDILRVEVV